MAYGRTHLKIVLAWAACIGISVGATVLFAATSNPSATEDAEIAKSLAAMLRAGRTVISQNQDRINDPNVGNKGLDGRTVLQQAVKLYQEATGVDPVSIDPKSPLGKLIRAQMDSILEVIDSHQQTINRQGVGFKGFIPAVFARLVNEAFSRRVGSIAAMKVTAPPQLIRNRRARPDEWETEVNTGQALIPRVAEGSIIRSHHSEQRTTRLPHSGA